MKLPKRKILPASAFILLFLALGLGLAGQLAYNQELKKGISQSVALEASMSAALSQKEASISALTNEVQNLKSSSLHLKLTLITSTLKKIRLLKDKIEKYKGLGVDVSTVSTEIPGFLDTLINERFEEASVSADALTHKLENAYNSKIEADKKAREDARKKFDSVVSGGGYTRHHVTTEAGTFLADVLIMDLSKVSVVTDTANSSDCKRDCPLLSLASFVNQNGGFAGINGTYFCPSDYDFCADKKNSYDFGVYSTRLGRWLNKANLYWDNRALITFKGSSGAFYKEEKNYSTGTSVSAGISMTPGLLKDGAVIVGEYNLESKETIRSNRSSLGYSDSKVYAVVGRGVTVRELAYVLKALGAKNAVALDGGGSVAMYYNGAYVAGPGRALPNAVIFKNR